MLDTFYLSVYDKSSHQNVNLYAFLKIQKKNAQAWIMYPCSHVRKPRLEIEEYSLRVIKSSLEKDIKILILRPSKNSLKQDMIEKKKTTQIHQDRLTHYSSHSFITLLLPLPSLPRRA